MLEGSIAGGGGVIVGGIEPETDGEADGGAEAGVTAASGGSGSGRDGVSGTSPAARGPTDDDRKSAVGEEESVR